MNKIDKKINSLIFNWCTYLLDQTVGEKPLLAAPIAWWQQELAYYVTRWRKVALRDRCEIFWMFSVAL